MMEGAVMGNVLGERGAPRSTACEAEGAASTTGVPTEVSFARSSERLNTWFKSTKLYKKVLEGYVTKRSMTAKAKLTIIIPVTVLLGIGFALMANVPIGRIALALVWIGHIVYFGFIVKTDRGEVER